MEITDFNMPTERPWNMLEGHKHAMEKEDFLCWFLIKSIEQGNFNPIETFNYETQMVELGFLEQHGRRLYSLTKKAKGLLWSVYGK